MFTFRRNYLFIAVIFLSANFSFGQNAPASADLKMIIKNAEEQTIAYREEFKDLLAKEKKTTETFAENGDVKKRTVIESNFLVYQSPRGEGAISEFRNVEKVNEKLISGGEKTPDEFFAEVRKTGSIEKELKKIQKESSRFDKSLEIQGLTLFEAPILSENFRPFFDFNLVGMKTIDGTDVYIVSYRQMKKSPYVLVNEINKNSNELSLDFNLNLPASIKKSDIFLSGELWIDAKTFQLRREERELKAQTANPVLLLKGDFEYQSSDYGILVPKHISLINYNLKNYKKNPSASVKDTQVSLDYSQFTKANVDIKVLDDDENPQ